MAGKVAQCPYCGLDYEKRTEWQKFCSSSCADKYRYHCTGTRKARIRQHQEDNKEKIKEQIKNRPNTKYVQWKAKLKKNYGLSPELYMKMFDAQEGLCKICKKEIKAVHSHTHIDHNHETGEIRGILCSNCNLGLGHFKDNVAFLFNAITYLGE